MKRVGIFVASEQKGFLISLALQFEKILGLMVTIIARDKHIVNLAKKILPLDNNINVVNYSEIPIKLNYNSVFEQAKRIESVYKVSLSMLISEDRALGQGYLSNVQKIPDIKRASWQYDKKIKYFVSEFIKKEMALDGLNIAIQIWPNKIVTKICKAKGIDCFSFVPIKFGDRRFWSDDEFISGSAYIKRIKNYLNNNKDKEILNYESHKWSENINKSAKYSYTKATKSALKVVVNDSKKFIRGTNKKDSYHYLGWLPSIFRSVSNYKYIKNNSIFPKDLSGYKVVLFNLHMEPEVALQYFSPEFSNSFEAITWISKSLPVNYLIVVKEQAFSFGVRSRWYYKQLRKIPNVVLSHPDVHSWEWIQLSDIVATITGTVGQEAVNFEKPVLSFGKHQVVNYLPTVYYVSNYAETNSALNQIIHNPMSKDIYKKSRVVLSNAQVDSSIDMPDYSQAVKSENLETTMASKAIKNLVKEYPSIFN
jgi:hypothetical protein